MSGTDPQDAPGEDGRTTRAQAQREERRAQILTAALQVFATAGYHNASVAQLVKAAGVARGTFYLYFESKQDVFLSLLDELLAAFRASVVGVDTQAGAPGLEAQLVDTVERILAAAQSQQALARILLQEAVGLGDAVDARVQAFEQELQDYIALSLSHGKTLGWVAPEVVEDVTAACVYGALRQVLVRLVIVGDRGHTLHDLATAIVRYQLRGIAGPA